MAERPESADPTPAVARAASALREHVDTGWVEARERIRSAALSATRRTWPLTLPGRGLYVTDQVVVALLRDRIDTVPHVKTTAVVITPAEDRIEHVGVEIGVAYGHPIEQLAGEVRRACGETLSGLFGESALPPVDVAAVTVEEPGG